MAPVFLVLVVAAVLCGAFTGRLEAVTEASLQDARKAVEIAIGLVGVMAFWLGLVEVLRRSGLLHRLALRLAPVFRRLFPDVPEGDPALAAMSLNIAANMLGLTNAATPLGLDAMQRLDRLNGDKGTATDAMALFLAINTSGLALLPLGVIGLRASLGSRDPAGIIVTTLLATTCSTVVAIVTAKLLSRLPAFRRSRPDGARPGGASSAPAAGGDAAAAAGKPAAENVEAPPAFVPASRARSAIAWALWLAAGVGGTSTLLAQPGSAGAAGGLRAAVSWLPLPLVILAVVLYGWAREMAVYDAIVAGAKEGFDVALRIIPYLVAVLVAVGMFRASGAFDLVVRALAPLTGPLGFPVEALPMALVRPLSGSGAFGVLTDILKTHGPDSPVGYLASTLQGSFETTFYVLAVYGGAVGLRRTRHTVAACLAGDLAGIVAATVACRVVLGP